jgi:hypothetical protein
MATAAVGLGAAGTLMSTIGSINNAKAQKATLAYEAAVALNNQKIANYQADLAVQNGEVAEQTQRLKTAGMMGDQRAALAANGVDLGEGSATEILATTKFMGERDALTIRDNASRQAWAYKNQGANYAAEAAADKATGSAINPTMAGVSSLLTGAGQVASAWVSYNKVKA